MIFERTGRQVNVSTFDAVGVDEVTELRKLLHLSLMPHGVLGRRVLEWLLLGISQLLPLFADSFSNFGDI